MKMAEGECRERWNHTSHLFALIFNVNRDPDKTRAIEPGEVNPYVKEKRSSGDGWEKMGQLFSKNKKTQEIKAQEIKTQEKEHDSKRD
jgi:hypothetical protein